MSVHSCVGFGADFFLFRSHPHLKAVLFPFSHAHPHHRAELQWAAAVRVEQSETLSVHVMGLPLSCLPMECGGDERKQEGDETEGNSQPCSLERALLAIPVSKSPASLQRGSLYIFLVKEEVSKLSLTAREFME